MSTQIALRRPSSPTAAAPPMVPPTGPDSRVCKGWRRA